MKLLCALLALSLSAFGQATSGGLNLTDRLNIGAVPFTISLPNSSTGTTVNKLAKAVTVGGVLQAQIITTSAADQAAVIGCVVSGAGTSGSALIVVVGTASCYFDAATTAGHIAVPSSTSAGALHDSGSTSSPSSGEVLATVGATNACGSPPCLIAGNLFMTPDLVAQGSQGNGGGSGGNPNKVTIQLRRRTACILIGSKNAISALADTDLADSDNYPLYAASTLIEVTVRANAGTPNIILGRDRAGSVVNLTSTALTTASSGGIACSNTGGTTSVFGTTTCSATLQNTALALGDWILPVSGTAGGTAKQMTACATWTIDN